MDTARSTLKSSLGTKLPRYYSPSLLFERFFRTPLRLLCTSSNAMLAVPGSIYWVSFVLRKRGRRRFHISVWATQIWKLVRLRHHVATPVPRACASLLESRNEKWKWGNGEMGRYISPSKLLTFCDCSHQMWWKSQCPSMHLLRDHLCLTVGTKGVSWSATTSDVYISFYFWQHVSFLKVCWIFKLFILCPNFIKGVILRLLRAVACIIIVSRTATAIYNSIYYSNLKCI